MVADHLVATVGEDGRQFGQAHPVLLVDAGGELPDAAAVCSHRAADSGSDDANRIGCGGEKQPNRVREGGDGEVAEESLEINHFQMVRLGVPSTSRQEAKRKSWVCKHRGGAVAKR